jgi:hypothetical protein
VARIFDPVSAMPHVLFVIDRQSKSAPLHFINTPRYAFHEDFLRAKSLLQGGKPELNRNYREPGRRFILGTLSWQPVLKDYSYEFWEGDQLTPELLQTTAAALKTGFFAPVRFKANSTQQEAVAQQAGVAAVTQAQLLGAQTYLPLNQGQAVGRLRILNQAEAVNDLQPRDIVLLREVPISLPPVAGVVTAPVNRAVSCHLLARGWGIPNAYVQKAAEQYADFNGRWVHIDVQPAGFALRAATAAEQQSAQQQALRQPAKGRKVLLQPDLRRSELVPLAALRSADRRRCGAKAANLGEIQSARLADVSVPDGFCIPFAAYADFMRANGLAERIARMRQQPGFATDAGIRRQALSALQAEIEQWPVSPAVADAWTQRWSGQLGSQGVFVRSSSSSEDLPNFSGAGLYTTVPNVRSGRTWSPPCARSGLDLQLRGLGSQTGSGHRRRAGDDVGVGAKSRGLLRLWGDDHPRPLRCLAPLHELYRRQARHRHPRGRGPAGCRADPLLQPQQGRAGAQPLPGRCGPAAGCQGRA